MNIKKLMESSPSKEQIKALGEDAIEAYLSLNYEIKVSENPQSFKEEYWAEYRQLKKVGSGYGLTEEDAKRDLNNMFRRYIRRELSKGILPPLPKDYRKMATYSIKESNIERIRREAEAMGISQGAYIEVLLNRS